MSDIKEFLRKNSLIKNTVTELKSKISNYTGSENHTASPEMGLIMKPVFAVVDREHKADIKVYMTDRDYKAKWKKSHSLKGKIS